MMIISLSFRLHDLEQKDNAHNRRTENLMREFPNNSLRLTNRLILIAVYYTHIFNHYVSMDEKILCVFVSPIVDQILWTYVIINSLHKSPRIKIFP